MSMFSDLKKEHKKISGEINAGQRKLKALESMMKEYGIRMRMNDSSISELVMECLQEHNGHAKFDEIVDCLRRHGVDSDRPQISLVLTKSPVIRYDKPTAEWVLVNQQVLERIGKAS